MNNDYIFKIRTDGDIVDLVGRVIGHINLEYIKSIAEIPQGEWHEHLDKGLLKARHKNYVVYDVDYLLDNLAREVNIMESARKMRKGGDD